MRFHVLGQNRGTHTPPEACPHSPPACRNLQAGYRHPLFRQDVVSHDANSIPSTPVESARSILLMASDAQVVGIDEAQFFDDAIVEVCNELANSGKRVIVAGLDMDFKGIPFGPMPQLMAIAEDVTKVHAICVKCGNLAHVSHRIVKDEQRVLLGEQHEYEPLCRQCYNKALTNNG